MYWAYLLLRLYDNAYIKYAIKYIIYTILVHELKPPMLCIIARNNPLSNVPISKHNIKI